MTEKVSVGLVDSLLFDAYILGIQCKTMKQDFDVFVRWRINVLSKDSLIKLEKKKAGKPLFVQDSRAKNKKKEAGK